jgi:hypothetical protein
MTGRIRAMLIECGREPREVQVKLGDEGTALDSLQFWVGGNIDVFDALYESLGGVTLYVNDDGIYECEPNRAVYATERMAEEGYLSQFAAGAEVVEPGELYTVLFGDIVAVGYDPAEGEDRSLTDEQASAVRDYFTGVSPAGSGLMVIGGMGAARKLARATA